MDATRGIDEEAVPTLFEWAGGGPALLRLTTIFYEKYVPEDPLLGPLFANMAPDHPERVAAWLGEVFGGPRSYSEHYGGYDRMVSRHIGKSAPRGAACALGPAPLQGRGRRWASDRSRMACRVRRVPRVGLADRAWRTRSRTPSRLRTCRCRDGRGSATRRPARECRRSPSRRRNRTPSSPEPTSRVSFAQHIKPLFRDVDRRSMRFAFDLWSHEEVAAHAERSSIACGRGRCRATELGRKTGSPSSSAGSTRERLPEAKRKEKPFQASVHRRSAATPDYASRNFTCSPSRRRRHRDGADRGCRSGSGALSPG